MEMSLDDIRKEYRTAKDRKEQIKILAQLNETTPRVILEMLHDAGEAVDMRWYNRPKRAQKAETPETPAVPEKEEIAVPVITEHMTTGRLLEILGLCPPDTLILDGMGYTIKSVTYSVVFMPDGDERPSVTLNG